MWGKSSEKGDLDHKIFDQKSENFRQRSTSFESPMSAAGISKMPMQYYASEVIYNPRNVLKKSFIVFLTESVRCV